MVLSKQITFKIFLIFLTCFRVQGFLLLRFNNINEEDLISNVMKVMKSTNVRNEESETLNNVVARGIDYFHELINFRKNDKRQLLHKKLVKRIIPHGYGVKQFEYDDKYKSVFKPLLRIHKRKPTVDEQGNLQYTYDLVYLLDKNIIKDVFPQAKDDKMLLKPFTIDNMEIKFLPDIDKDVYLNEKHGGKIGLDNSEFDRYKFLDSIRQVKAKNMDNLNGHLYENAIVTTFRRNQEPTAQNDIVSKVKRMKTGLRNVLSHLRSQVPVRHGLQLRDDDDINKLKHVPDKFKILRSVGRSSSNQTQDKEKKRAPKEKKNLRMENISDLSNLYAELSKTIEVRNKYENEVSDTENQNDKQVLRTMQKSKPMTNGPTKRMIFTDLTNLRSNNKKYQSIKSFLNKYENKKLPTISLLNTEQLNALKHILVKWNSNKLNKVNKSRPRNIFRVQGLIGQAGKQHKDEIYDDSLDREGYIYQIGKKNEVQASNDYNVDSKYEKKSYYNKYPTYTFDRVKNAPEVEIKETSNLYKLLKTILQLKSNDVKNYDDDSNDEGLRSQIFQKSGEDEDEIPIPLEDLNILPTTTARPRPKPAAMVHPFWNYWTYDKGIIIDECKGNLIQLGNICVGKERRHNRS